MQLRQLNFSSCEFSGPLPSSLLDLGQLSVLDLSFNQLEGEIPDGLFKIETLALRGNTLTYQGEPWVEEPDVDEVGRDTMDVFKPSMAYDPDDTTRMSYSEDMFMKFFAGGLGKPGKFVSRGPVMTLTPKHKLGLGPSATSLPPKPHPHHHQKSN